MCDENYDKFINDTLKPFLNEYNNRYDSKHLLKIISEKEEQFITTLNDKQKAQFQELWDLLVDYYAVAKTEPFPEGYIESMIQRAKESE